VTYEIIYDSKAVDGLNRLPKEIKAHIFNKAKGAKENPEHFFEQLSGRADCKLRIGDYRLIADINHPLKRIEVTLVDHRKRVYKRLAKQ